MAPFCILSFDDTLWRTGSVGGRLDDVVHELNVDRLLVDPALPLYNIIYNVLFVTLECTILKTLHAAYGLKYRLLDATSLDAGTKTP